MEDYERVICVKNEVFVYQIPARTSNRGFRAAEWNLDNPSWTGRLRAVSKEKELQLKLEDRNSGELFAMCPVDKYPGMAVEQVLDSSRYFVIRIQDPTGRHAFIGIGFADRADSFDLLVTMQDHFKWIKREEKELAEEQAPQDLGPKLDLSFKEGQTIKINIGNISEDGGAKKPSRPRKNIGGTPGLLPPPPGGIKLPAPPKGPSSDVLSVTTAPRVTPAPTQPSSAASQPLADLDFLGGVGGPPAAPVQPLMQPTIQPAAQSDPWGDFASAGSASNQSSAASQSTGWVQF